MLDQGDVDLLNEATEDFRKDAPSAAIFLKRGARYVAGDRLVQSDLARTLRAVSRLGVAGFYKGPVAAALVAASKGGGGIITQADLDAYQTRELPPLECDYRDFHIVSAPPPSSGGGTLCQLLLILEGYPLGELGYGSAQALHYQIEAMRHAYVDRNHLLGDPAFVNNPLERLSIPSMHKRSAPRSTRSGQGIRRRSVRASRRTKAATRLITPSRIQRATPCR